MRAHLGGALEARRIPDGGHVVVCGIGNVGFRVVEELLSQGEQVVAIERPALATSAFIATARRQGVPVVIGDATVPEVLKQARAGTARAVIAATSKELINLEIGLLAREINPKQRVVLLLVDAQLAQTVREAADVRLAVSIPAALARPRVRGGIARGPYPQRFSCRKVSCWPWSILRSQPGMNFLLPNRCAR